MTAVDPPSPDLTRSSEALAADDEDERRYQLLAMTSEEDEGVGIGWTPPSPPRVARDG